MIFTEEISKKKRERERKKERKRRFHINGLLVVALLLLLNDEGIKGGGNVEVVVKPTLFVELNCSSVGGFMRLANGF